MTTSDFVLSHGVEADFVAFGVDEECKETEALADFGFWHDDLTACAFDSIRHNLQVGTTVQIDLDALFGWSAFAMNDCPADAFLSLMKQEAHRDRTHRHRWHVEVEDLAVEIFRAFEIDHWDFKPAYCISRHFHIGTLPLCFNQKTQERPVCVTGRSLSLAQQIEAIKVGDLDPCVDEVF